MGNVAVGRARGDDEGGDARLAVAEAAAAGARRGVLEAADQAEAADGAGRGPGALGARRRVGVPHAETAAAEGAGDAVRAVARRLAWASDLGDAERAAAAGGVRAAALLAVPSALPSEGPLVASGAATPQLVDVDRVAAAAATGACAACYRLVQAQQPRFTANGLVGKLLPILAGYLALADGACRTGSLWIVSGVMVVVLVLMF